jgi:hypothetical protein
MKSDDMKKKKVSELTCNFCKKEFVREGSFLNHICEPKRRWQDKDMAGNRIGFTAWLEFFTKHNNNSKKKDYMDFIESAYYSAFVKFGNYCVDAQVLNPNRYVDYLLKNKISVDTWHRDSVYTKFIIDYLKTEDPLDAIARSIETTVKLAEQESIQTKDVLRYGNRNKICYEITKGRISPWMLFQSESGLQFIESLDSTQQKMILEYINPEQWAIKFKRHKNIIPEIKELLNAGGY